MDSEIDRYVLQESGLGAQGPVVRMNFLSFCPSTSAVLLGGLIFLWSRGGSREGKLRDLDSSFFSSFLDGF